MPELQTILEIQDGELTKFIKPGQKLQKVTAKIVAMGCLPGGMKSGLPSFMVVIEMPDGERVIAETSWRVISIGMVGLIAHWGTP